jgi:hypothetical protein
MELQSASKRFFDPIVVGHNSFFGVDHLSSARGQQREAYFSNPVRIIETIEFARDHGATGLMISTHEKAAAVADLIRRRPALLDSIRVYPLLPYAQKYVTAANEKGLMNVVLDVLGKANTSEKISMIWSGATAIFTKDVRRMLSGLITAELQVFKGLNIPCVFLHDILTDLALALDLRGVVEFYHEEMEGSFRTRAAFSTKNLPLLTRKFKEWGLPEPLVMPHVNKIGFSMNPSREACEETLRSVPMKVMAMSTLASGFLKPDDAYEYLGRFNAIESVVVGASSPVHITETFNAIKKYMRLQFAS